MNKVAVFVDITDLYYKLLKTYNNGKLDYVKYLNHVSGELAVAIAYGCQENKEANPFIKYLRSLGFFTKYKRPYTLKINDRDIKRCNWLVGVAVDAIKATSDKDVRTIVLGTSNPDIIPLIKYLQEQGIEVIIFASKIPVILTKLTKCIEIPEDFLSVEDETT